MSAGGREPGAEVGGAQGATAARRAALATLVAVTRGERIESALGRRARALGRRDRALAMELAYGTVRWRGRIDYHLERALPGGTGSLPGEILEILRLGAYQLLFTRIPAWAATDEAVTLARERGYAGLAPLVNAVLHRLPGIAGDLPSAADGLARHLAVSLSHPLWLVERWLDRFGEEGTRALMAWDNLPPAIVVRPNAPRIGALDLRLRLAREGIVASVSPLWGGSLVLSEGTDVGRLSSFREGLFVVQDTSSSLVALLLSPAAGCRVVDLCAAPGGKATHLAGMVGTAGSVVAIDRAPQRIRLVAESAMRLRLPSLRCAVADAERPPVREAEAVLVDAPCSGTGVLRRRVDARWRRSAQEIRSLVLLQGRMLRAAAPLLRRGGTLVYSTCSLEPEENWGVVESFLADHREFHLTSARGYVPEAVVDERGCLATLPHRHGVDGVFAVRMDRVQ